MPKDEKVRIDVGEDGSVQITGPSLDEVLRALCRKEAEPDERSFPFQAATRHRRNLTRTRIGSLEQTEGEAAISAFEAEDRLWRFLKNHRSFKTKDAMAAWAQDEVPTLDDFGEPNPQYHAVWARVQTLIDMFAEQNNLYYRTRRIGRGTVYQFVTPKEADESDMVPKGGSRSKRRLKRK